MCPRCSGRLTQITDIMLNCDGCSRWWRKHVRQEFYLGISIAIVEGIIGTINDVGKEAFIVEKRTYTTCV